MSTGQISEAASGRDPSYLRLLLVLLGTATFFEGYDSAINAVVLRDLADTFGVNPQETRNLTGPMLAIGLGAFGALFVTAIGDRIGRRPLLIATTLLYATFTGLTATAQNLVAFAVFQFLARMFLISELATAITMVAEEFPAERRGRALGTLTALGAVALPVVAVSHFLLSKTALGWRALYLIGLLPLLLVALLRLKLRESERWLRARAEGRAVERMRVRDVVTGGYRRLLRQVSALFFLTHFALLGASTWWTYYAREERGFSIGTVTLLLSVAYLIGVSGYLVAGRLQDRIGRKPTGTIFLLAGCVFGIAVFQTAGRTAMFPLLALAIFFGFGVSPVMSALAAELFPTEMRATAVAFARSIFGTLGAITGPLTVGLLADRKIGLIGNVGDSVSIVALMYIAAALVLRLLPETAGRELESIAAAAQIPDASEVALFEP